MNPASSPDLELFTILEEYVNAPPPQRKIHSGKKNDDNKSAAAKIRATQRFSVDVERSAHTLVYRMVADPFLCASSSLAEQRRPPDVR